MPQMLPQTKRRSGLRYDVLVMRMVFKFGLSSVGGHLAPPGLIFSLTPDELPAEDKDIMGRVDSFQLDSSWPKFDPKPRRSVAPP